MWAALNLASVIHKALGKRFNLSKVLCLSENHIQQPSQNEHPSHLLCVAGSSLNRTMEGNWLHMASYEDLPLPSRQMPNAPLDPKGRTAELVA